MGKDIEVYTRLDMARAMYRGLRKGDKAFFMAEVASDYLKKIYGAKSECYNYCLDLKIEAFKRCEHYFPKDSKPRKAPPPVPPRK